MNSICQFCFAFFAVWQPLFQHKQIVFANALFWGRFFAVPVKKNVHVDHFLAIFRRFCKEHGHLYHVIAMVHHGFLKLQFRFLEKSITCHRML